MVGPQASRAAQFRDNLLTEMLCVDEIDESCYTYLCNSNPRTPRFYTLPKIHKAARPPPGQPILLANQCPTERISKFVDFFLKPTIPHLKSYIKDSTHFLQFIQNIKGLPETAMLVTLDVISLNTNILNKEGIRAAAKTLAKHHPGAKHPTNQSLIRLLTSPLEQTSTKGLWSEREKRLQINIQELKAVYLALQNFQVYATHVKG